MHQLQEHSTVVLFMGQDFSYTVVLTATKVQKHNQIGICLILV